MGLPLCCIGPTQGQPLGLPHGLPLCRPGCLSAYWHVCRVLTLVPVRDAILLYSARLPRASQCESSTLLTLRTLVRSTRTAGAGPAISDAGWRSSHLSRYSFFSLPRCWVIGRRPCSSSVPRSRSRFCLP